jgi:hypothetical protein
LQRLRAKTPCRRNSRLFGGRVGGAPWTEKSDGKGNKRWAEARLCYIFEGWESGRKKMRDKRKRRRKGRKDFREKFRITLLVILSEK